MWHLWVKNQLRHVPSFWGANTFKKVSSSSSSSSILIRSDLLHQFAATWCIRLLWSQSSSFYYSNGYVWSISMSSQRCRESVLVKVTIATCHSPNFNTPTCNLQTCIKSRTCQSTIKSYTIHYRLWNNINWRHIFQHLLNLSLIHRTIIICLYLNVSLTQYTELTR